MELEPPDKTFTHEQLICCQQSINHCCQFYTTYSGVPKVNEQTLWQWLWWYLYVATVHAVKL